MIDSKHIALRGLGFRYIAAKAFVSETANTYVRKRNIGAILPQYLLPKDGAKFNRR
jgi:hypothetical protein